MICKPIWILSFLAVSLLAVAFGAQAKDASMFKFESSYQSLTALLDADAKTPLDADDFDEELWLLLTKKIDRPDDLTKYPAAVGVYFASRCVQWEVDNGGFVQAAENVPAWFPLAASGYQTLGKPKSAALITKAMAILRTASDDSLESQLEALNKEIPADEWSIDGDRVEYARKHRRDFALVR